MEKSRLTITISLNQGAELRVSENADGSTRLCVKAGQNNRMSYFGDHPAKFTDMLAVLNGQHVDNAAAYRAANISTLDAMIARLGDEDIITRASLIEQRAKFEQPST
jgi:hypothetical protein